MDSYIFRHDCILRLGPFAFIQSGAHNLGLKQNKKLTKNNNPWGFKWVQRLCNAVLIWVHFAVVNAQTDVQMVSGNVVPFPQMNGKEKCSTTLTLNPGLIHSISSEWNKLKVNLLTLNQPPSSPIPLQTSSPTFITQWWDFWGTKSRNVLQTWVRNGLEWRPVYQHNNKSDMFFPLKMFGQLY